MSAAARQKLRRSREARGVAVYGVEVGGDVLDSLCGIGLLADIDTADRVKVAEALGAALRRWAADEQSSRVTLNRFGLRYDPHRKDA